MLNKKKTNYESKGLVRRIAGSIFSSRGAASGGVTGGDDGVVRVPVKIMSSNGTNGNDSKWRPRKKQFERLDADDEDCDSIFPESNKWTIKSVFSTESDAGEYKREILYERKKAILKHQVRGPKTPGIHAMSVSNNGKKRDLSDFNLKPPSKDTVVLRANSASKKKKSKCSLEGRNSHENKAKDPFARDISTLPATDLFEIPGHGDNTFLNRIGDESFASESFHRRHHDDESSRQTVSSRHTSSSKHTHPSLLHPSFNTVSSDPSDFFSKDAVNTLTQQNLNRMAAIAGTYSNIPEEQTKFGGYQNHGQRSNNLQSKFYQFAIDEDKESTVVESNVFPLSFMEDDDQLAGENIMRNNDHEEGSADDESEYNASVASKGTRIQKRAPVPHGDAIEEQKASHSKAKTNLFFKKDMEQKPLRDLMHSPKKTGAMQAGVGNDDDTFVALIQHRNFAAYNGTIDLFEQSNNDSFMSSHQQSPPPSQGVVAKNGRQASAHSLSDIPTAKNHRKNHEVKKSPLPPFGRHVRDGRFPLSPLSNIKPIGGQSNTSLIPPMQHSTNVRRNDEFPAVGASEGNERKPDPDESRFDVSHQLTSSTDKGKIAKRMQQTMIKKPDPFVDGLANVSSKTVMVDKRSGTKTKQKRDPSISGPFPHEAFEDVGTSDLFPSSASSWSFHEVSAPQMVVSEGESTKENFPKVKFNREFGSLRRDKAAITPAIVGFQQSKQATVQTSDEYVDMDSSVNSEEENQDSNDDDSFDSVALWERSNVVSQAAPIGIQNFPKDAASSSVRSIGAQSRSIHSHSARHNSLCSHGLPKSACPRAHDHDINVATEDVQDDDRSLGKVSTSASYTKPLALPSNAIMASMLFRTHYDIDKTTVEKKIKATEDEHIRYQKSRRGDIPDSVLADHDYMTTVSSFSDGTNTQEAWKKPSRDLLDYFSKARTLDMESKKYLQSHQVKWTNNNKGAPLFEA